MKLASMQPYFFPYLGYFSLIKNSETFILNDCVQFIHQGWINRNRVLHQVNGWIYIRVPLAEHSHKTLIKDIRIDNTRNWKQKIVSQVEHYKKNAPYYFKIIDLLNELFEKNHNDLVSLNKDSIISVCKYLQIETEVPVFSEMKLAIDKPEGPGDWGLNICKALDISEYWNPQGGKDFHDKRKYESAGICLKFHQINLVPYDQKRNDFEQALSIIDVMMFNSREEINKMLDDYKLF